MLDTLKARVGWRAKVAIKLAMSRLPLQYSAFKRMGMNVHGGMEDPEYSYTVFARHFERWSATGHLRPGWIGLEIGPGDSLAGGLIARAHGASRVYLVDSGAFANVDMSVYRTLVDSLRARGLEPPDVSRFERVDDMLRELNIEYLDRGVSALSTIERGTVDFSWSQAVLEHVRRAEFTRLVSELYRVLRSDGFQSHRIDLKDHLGASLNNLRFPAWVWESEVFARGGFYTNRLRYSEVRREFEDAGFRISTPVVDRWTELPLKPRSLDPEFRNMERQELLVSGFDLTARV